MYSYSVAAESLYVKHQILWMQVTKSVCGGFVNKLCRDEAPATGAIFVAMVWLSCSVVDCINEVSQHQARLVLGWVTIPVCNLPPRSTQPGHPSMGRCNEYQQKLGHTRGIQKVLQVDMLD